MKIDNVLVHKTSLNSKESVKIKSQINNQWIPNRNLEF